MNKIKSNLSDNLKEIKEKERLKKYKLNKPLAVKIEILNLGKWDVVNGNLDLCIYILSDQLLKESSLKSMETGKRLTHWHLDLETVKSCLTLFYMSINYRLYKCLGRAYDPLITRAGKQFHKIEDPRMHVKNYKKYIKR